MSQGFDCAAKLNGSSAAALRASGFEYVARYLPTSAWKGLTADEVNTIKQAGLKLVSVFEKGATKAAYFTKSQGMADAQEAYKLAKSLGQPVGSAIYFTVDYDAQPKDMAAILDYLSGVKKCLVDYKVGLYGSYAVMQAVRGHADYYWQTYAWSHGNVADFVHIWQYKNGVTVSAVQLDRDEIKQEPGAWGQVSQPKSSGFIMVVRAIGQGDIRAEPSHASGFIRNTKDGELFNVIEIQNDWHKVAISNSETGWIDGNKGQNLYWVDNPALKGQPAPDTPSVYYVVKSGDTLSKIAANNHTTIDQLQAWNGIKNPNLIKVGQKLRVK